MGKYNVTAPVVYLEGNKVIHYLKPSREPVKIEDSVAAKLGDKVSKVGGEPEQAPEQSAAETAPDPAASQPTEKPARQRNRQE